MEQRQYFQVVMERMDIYMKKKKNLDTDFTLFTKINSKWMDHKPKCKMQNS